MTIRVEVGPEDSPNRTLDSGDVIQYDVAKPHTALADAEVEVPYDRQIRQRATEAMRIYDTETSTLVFRGYLKKLDYDQDRGVTRLSGPGVADDLKASAIERTFTNTTYEDAIRSVWNNDTQFDDVTVYAPDVDQVVSDDVLADAPSSDAWSDIVTLADTAPIRIADVDGDGSNELDTLQTTFHNEVEDLGPINTVSTSAASEGAAGSFFDGAHGVSGSITTDYTIPQSDIGVAIRRRYPDDTDGDGNFEGPGIDVSLAGDDYIRTSTSFESGDDNWSWETSVGDGSSDLSAGTHSVDIEIKSNTGAIYIDLVVVYDNRFSYTFDNTTDSDNHLSGPELYPDAYDVVFDQISTALNVVEIGITSSWNETTNNQAIATSADERSTWNNHPNTASTEDDYSGNVGSTVDTRATMGRTDDTRTTETPTSGYKGHYIDTWEVDYDGTNLPIIEGRTFRGTPFQVIQQMHRDGGYRFAVDHAATDGSGNLIKKVESFQAGTQSNAKDWSVVNRNPTLSYEGYANEVTIYGKERDDGTRPTVTIQNEDEVSAEGVEPFVDTRPELDSVEDVKGYARAVLRERVRAKDQTGRLTVLPTNILPGYDYPVDWFADGSTTDSALERVRFSRSAGQMRGSLRFTVDDDVTAVVINQGYELASTKQSI